MSEDLDLFGMPTEIPGSRNLSERYGPRHTFHDGEIQSIVLNAAGTSELRILTWKMTAEVDQHGYYVLTKRAIVTFMLSDVSDCELNGFRSGQNVVGSLRVERIESGYRLFAESIVGVSGYIDATHVAIDIEPIDS